MNVLVWITRDLRAADNPALAHAAALGAVLPVFVADPAAWAAPEMSGRHWAFVAESLHDLRAQLAGIGLPLIVRRGPPAEVLCGLSKTYGIGMVVAGAGADPDGQVAARLRAGGIGWTELPDAPAVVPAAIAAVPGVEPGLIPDARALGLAPDRCPGRQGGGRARGLALLDTFLTRRGEGYRATLASPLAAAGAGSRLSPHLAWGTLSAAEVAAAARARRAERPGGAWTGALRSFQARLALRDRPADGQPPLPPPRGGDGALAAWEAGETGFPYVDACLRALGQTGWLPHRARALVAATALGQLGLDPRRAGQALARLCTDYDAAIHWPEMGAAGQRLSDPVAQGRAQDPGGAMIRRYLPELAAVPDAFLHTPWLWPGAQGLLDRRYPRPPAGPSPLARPPSPARGPRPRLVDARQLALDL